MLFLYGQDGKNRFEALFLKMLGRLPVDVLILDPDRSAAFALEDQLLYQMNFTETAAFTAFSAGKYRSPDGDGCLSCGAGTGYSDVSG